MLRVSLLLLLELSATLSRLVVPPGSSLTLPCLPNGTPTLNDAKITWRFTPTPESDDQQLFDHNQDLRSQHLVLTSVTASHAGVYECVTEGWAGESRMKLRKKYSVHVLGDHDSSSFEEWQVVKATAGGSVVLPCIPANASGTVKSLVWIKGGNGTMELPTPTQEKEGVSLGKEEGSVRKADWTSPNPAKGDWSIQIYDITEQDSDMYRCEFKNHAEVKRSLSVELIVEAAPTVPPSRCLAHRSPWEPCIDEESRAWKAILGESLTQFSMELYSKLRLSQPSQNLLFSPISIAGVLSHLLLGARGETRTALESALMLPPSFSCLHTEMRKLREEVKDSLEMASHMFYSPEAKLGASFMNQSLEFYSAVPEKLTNSSELNVKMINDWVANKTHHKITKLVEYVDAYTQLILLNAVYFNGKWKVKFDGKPQQAAFTKLSGDILQVPVLYSSKYKLAMNYDSSLKAQVASFPLTGKNRLLIVLPASSSLEDLKLLEGKMNYDTVKNMANKMKKFPTQFAEVTLPKIKLDVSTDLADLLEKIGLSDLFGSPNLCALFPDSDSDSLLALSDARHRASLSLSETGVEAGAATAIYFSRSFTAFSALQPFILLLWSDQADAPLFMGRVTQP